MNGTSWIDQITAREIIRTLEENTSWLILVHENPDGDTLGCGLALYSLGRRLGKTVRIAGKTPMPDGYHFLPFSDEYEAKRDLTQEDTKGALLISVDTSTVERSLNGLCDAVLQMPSINIDHHGDNQMYSALNLVMPQASATAEIITELFLHSPWKIEKNEAICLYAALVTDNGNFRFKSTTPHSHFCAAKLLEAGAEPSEIDDMVNQNMTPAIMRLWGTAFCRVQVFLDGRAAMFWLDAEDFTRAEADSSAVDGLVNMLLRIKGIKIAAFLSVFEGNNKLSVRTRAPYCAREIAAAFGGGGHVQAAGAKISGNFDDALRDVKAEIEKYVSGRHPSGQ